MAKTSSVPQSQAWSDALALHQDLPVDIIASIREEAINYILSKHFQFDNDRYSLTITKTISITDPAGHEVDRDVKITITANTPLTVELPPYKQKMSGRAWNSIETGGPGGTLTIPPLPPQGGKLGTGSETVHVFCSSLTISLMWPKLTGTGNWTFTSQPISIAAQAAVQLKVDADGPVLHLQVLSVWFGKTQFTAMRRAVARKLASLPKAERGAPQDECEEKFTDLLLIAANMVATQYAPAMVQDIHIPVPVMLGHVVHPSLFEMGDKVITIGATVDGAALFAAASTNFERLFRKFNGLLERDIELAGGFERVFIKERKGGRVVPRTKSELATLLPLSSAFLSDIRKATQPVKRVGTKAAGIDDGFGVGINADVLTRFARSAMPAPVQQCEEKEVLYLLKGGVCWWMHVWNPNINIAKVTISGTVNVDIGGSIEACVRKVYECSTSWDCATLSLAVVGSPGLSFTLSSGNGIVFTAQADPDGLRIVTNLPSPFDQVINAFSGWVFQGLVAVLDLVARNIHFQILTPDIAIPKQNTKLSFSDVNPFAFVRNSPNFPDPPRKTFIGFSVGVTASK